MFHRILFILSGRYFATYDFNLIVAGGCFDQTGLTRILATILATEIFTVLAWYLCSLISARRKWRIACTVVFLLAFVLPVVSSVEYTWELSRYIATMGITAKRIVGVRYAILFFFIPAFCAVKWIAGRMTWMKNMWAIGICLLLAYATVAGIDAGARRSIASHPRPNRCLPNYGAYVPQQPECPTDYGLLEIVFGVRRSK